MEQPGLDYRFKRLVVSPDVIHSVMSVMANVVPPRPSWWQDNCYFVNGFFFPHSILDSRFAFCNYKTKYDVHWPLIRFTFEFVTTYLRVDYWYTSEETGVAYWRPMEALLSRIRSICEKNSSAEEFDKVFRELTQALDGLATLANSPVKTPLTSEISRDLPHWLQQQSVWQYKFKNKLCSMTAEIRLYAFNPHRLKNRLTRHAVGYPESGDKPAFGNKMEVTSKYNG